MLMSQNRGMVASHLDENGAEVTSPLTFDFSDKSFIFRKYQTKMDIIPYIQNDLLPVSDGVIVSLARQARNVKYLASADPLPSLLRQVVKVVRHSKRPTIFAVQHAPLPQIPAMLGLSDIIPLITYDYSEPVSLQRLFLSLISKIEQN
jgi:hypothetical protein